MMMPAWVASGVRLVVREPAASARLDFPRPSRKLGDGRWRWRVRGRLDRALDVTAWQGTPQVGHGPRLGSWEQTVEYFQERPRGYLPDGGELHRVETSHSPAAAWPLQAEVATGTLLPALLPLRGGADWPLLHSAFLCPEIPFAFELGVVAKPQVAAGVPQAAASRSAARRRLPHRGAPMLRGMRELRELPAPGRPAAPRERREAVEAETEEDAATVEAAAGA
jgi:hypothetical protein